MSQVRRGRWTAAAEEGNIVFLIGMRINSWWKPWTWARVMTAMPRMLTELARNPDLGLLGARTFVGGRAILVVQYWRSFDDLTRYARNSEALHLPAWRAFNRLARAGQDVGVFHETYVIGPVGAESVYVNMPAFGLAKATTAVPVAQRGESARRRLDPQAPDEPAVPATI
jgi:hypothetical protein